MTTTNPTPRALAQQGAPVPPDGPTVTFTPPPAGYQPAPPPAGPTVTFTPAGTVQPTGVDGFTTRAKVAFAAAGAVFLGAFLPFATITVTEFGANGYGGLRAGVRYGTAWFAVLLAVAVAFTYRARRRRTAFTTVAVLASLATFGYLIFTVGGLVGTTRPDGDGFTAKITWAPSIGLVLTVAGVVTALVVAIRELRGTRS